MAEIVLLPVSWTPSTAGSLFNSLLGQPIPWLATVFRDRSIRAKQLHRPDAIADLEGLALAGKG